MINQILELLMQQAERERQIPMNNPFGAGGLIYGQPPQREEPMPMRPPMQEGPSPPISAQQIMSMLGGRANGRGIATR